MRSVKEKWIGLRKGATLGENSGWKKSILSLAGQVC